MLNPLTLFYHTLFTLFKEKYQCGFFYRDVISTKALCPADSDSNAESDSDGSENNTKGHQGMEVDSDAEKTLWNVNEASLSSYSCPSNLPSSSSLSFQPHANPQSSPAGLLGTTGVSGSGTVSKGKVMLPSVSSTTTGIGSTLSPGKMLRKV